MRRNATNWDGIDVALGTAIATFEPFSGIDFRSSVPHDFKICQDMSRCPTVLSGDFHDTLKF